MKRATANLAAEQKQARAIRYKPFAALEGISHRRPDEIPQRVTQIAMVENLIKSQDWYGARKLSAKLIQTGLAGLHYLQTYERLLIRGIVTTAYTGWAAYASLYIFRPLDYSHTHGPTLWSSYAVSATSAFVLVGFWTLFAIQSSPGTFYLYIAFPCYFWRQFLVQVIPALRNRRDFEHYAHYYVGVLSKAILVIVVLQGMVVCTIPFYFLDVVIKVAF